ncbi:hypothetical protein LC612_42840 [Nostoc sp. CHAB 5834]|nr:hypothetical protein [Nostoc sp. CHAB 5834]
MNLDRISSNPEWTKRKLELIRQHHDERQRYFAAEDESWRSLQQRHYQQRRELADNAAGVLKWKQFICQQVQDVKYWRQAMATNRLLLQARQSQETLDLEAEKVSIVRRV